MKQTNSNNKWQNQKINLQLFSFWVTNDKVKEMMTVCSMYWTSSALDFKMIFLLLPLPLKYKRLTLFEILEIHGLKENRKGDTSEGAALLRSSTRMPFANSSLTSWIIFESKVIPFALNAFPQWKKFKEFTAMVEWWPQLSFFTTVISIERGCRHNVCACSLGPSVHLSGKSSSPSVLWPWIRPQICIHTAHGGKGHLSVGQGTAQVIFPLWDGRSVTQGGTHFCSN